MRWVASQINVKADFGFQLCGGSQRRAGSDGPGRHRAAAAAWRVAGVGGSSRRCSVARVVIAFIMVEIFLDRPLGMSFW